jgi:hypothetical protein
LDDCIIDTNVLLVASAQHPGSPFKDSDVPAEQKQNVLEWLMRFREDGQRVVVLDELWKIWEEYNRKMTGQDIGLMVVTEKLQLSLMRPVDVAYDKNGHGCLPPELKRVIHDPADRKFVAAALADREAGDESTIVNAVDTDWCDWERALKRYKITVTHIIEELCEDKRRRKAKR